MQRPYNDRWERTKWYLFRNLLENPGFRLSPVPEESRSESSDDRPYSPLPDLIIEREPNRHDETEEFYQGLEVRMKRYYKRLFVDGPIDSDAEISEFEVNQSMASTFIMNANDHELSEADEIRARGDCFDKIENSSYSSNTDSNDSSKDERTEVVTALDHSKHMQLQSNESKSIDTESDSPQDCHKISITKVEIHEEVKRTKPMTRVFEDGSPVLIPRCYKFSRIVFGNMSRDIMNANKSDDNVILEDVDNENIEDIEGSVNIIENNSKDKVTIEVSSEESDLEVQWLMEKPKASSTALYKTLEGKVTDIEQIISQDKDQEETANDQEEIDDDNHEAMAEAEKIHVLLTKNDDKLYKTIGSIGTDELLPTGAASDIITDDNSIELAITRGMFETKNRVKISSFTTDKSNSDSEELEDIEIMRGTVQARLHESLQRESISSHESPIVGKFATRTTATEIEEDSELVNDEIDASVEKAKDSPMEFQQSFQRESSTTQDSSVVSTTVTQAPTVEDENESSDDGKESSEIAGNTTPPLGTRSVKDACNDIWSVSPIDIDFEELPPHASHVAISVGGIFNKNKRESEEIIEKIAPKSKKKKYKNAEIQTSATKKPRNTWNDIKTDLFVGSRLIYKLCGCRDHICS